MYCPNCGKDNSNEQRFCRSCGLNLQAISQLVVGELSRTNSGESPIQAVRNEPKRLPSPLTYGLLIIVLGLTIALFGKKVLFEDVVGSIGMLIALLGVGLIGLKGIFLMLPESRTPSASRSLPKGELPIKLPAASQFGVQPSVTEQTTRQLD